jgi:predicted nucleotidyltransferase
LEETIETARKGSVELDLVTHDVKKFFKLLLRPNGYVLEQLLSPIVVHSTTEHEELKAISVDCLTRHHVHHYLGFAENQWRLFLKEVRPRIKPLLYTFRVLLTGIHLMRSGEIQANLNHLHSMYPLPYLPELIARKRDGVSQQTLPSAETAFYETEFGALRERLVREAATTRLPEANSAAPTLNDMLIRIRLNGLSSR